MSVKGPEEDIELSAEDRAFLDKLTEEDDDGNTTHLSPPPGFSPTPRGNPIGMGGERGPYDPEAGLSPIKMKPDSELMPPPIVAPRLGVAPLTEGESGLQSLLRPTPVPLFGNGLHSLHNISPISEKTANQSSMFGPQPQVPSPMEMSTEADIESAGQSGMVTDGKIPVDEINVKFTAYNAEGFGDVVKMDIVGPEEGKMVAESDIPGDVVYRKNQSVILDKITSTFNNSSNFNNGFAFDPSQSKKQQYSSLMGRVTSAREAWAALAEWGLKNKSDARYPKVIAFMKWLNTQVGTDWRTEDFEDQNAHDFYRSIIKPETIVSLPTSSVKSLYNPSLDKEEIKTQLENLKNELKINTIGNAQRTEIDNAIQQIETGTTSEGYLKGVLQNIAKLNSTHLKNQIIYAPSRFGGVSKDPFKNNALTNFILKKRFAFGTSYGGRTHRHGNKVGARKTKRTKGVRKTRRCRK